MGRRDLMLIRSDSIFCFLNNIKVNIEDLLKHRINKNIRNNSKLRQDRDGICFVIGNGPSLKNVNLSLIEGNTSITVNGFYFSDTLFKSDYHVLVDPAYKEKEYSEAIEKAVKNNPNLKFIVRQEIESEVNKITKNQNEIIPILANHSLVGSNIEIDMTKEMTGSINVIPVAIECAMYMGFKTICLLGCDFSLYTQTKGLHYYDKEEIENKRGNYEDIEGSNVGNLIRCALVHKQHYCLEKKAKEIGIQIFNATKESLIDAYDFIDLEELVNKCHQ